MNNKFLFVNLSIKSGFIGVNHGIAYLVPVVKKYSYDVACLNIQKEMSCEDFLSKISEYGPAIVGFSCTTNQLKYLKKYSKALTKCPEILQIAGGVASTLDPDWILTKTDIKGACIGEGEVPIANLLSTLKKGQEITETEGFYWKLNGAVKRNEVPDFVADLSNLEFPDYSVFEKDLVSYDGILHIMLSRGCPYSCFHCCNKALSKVYPSSKEYFRLPSPDHSVALIENTIDQYPKTRFIGFEDDLLIANRAWFDEFSNEYSKRIHLPYRLCARPECVDQSIVKRLKNSGCTQVSIGIESGNEEIRKNLLNRCHTNALLIEKCSLIKDAGINLFTFNIVGFPGETRKEMLDTYELNKIISPDSGDCFYFYPYENTELYNICKKKGLLKSEAETLEITNYCSMPSIQMDAEQERACIHFHDKLIQYFAKQRLLLALAHLPSGIRKYPTAFYLWGRSFAESRPWLTGLVVMIYRASGIRPIMMHLMKNNPK